jgi:hypothetical protein
MHARLRLISRDANSHQSYMTVITDITLYHCTHAIGFFPLSTWSTYVLYSISLFILGLYHTSHHEGTRAWTWNQSLGGMGLLL